MNRKKFQTLLYSDVHKEIDEIKNLDKGFTNLFIYSSFIVLFFLVLSLQLDVPTHHDINTALTAAIGGERYLGVSTVDDAFDVLETIFLNNFETAYEEHACFDCVQIDKFMKRKIG